MEKQFKKIIETSDMSAFNTNSKKFSNQDNKGSIWIDLLGVAISTIALGAFAGGLYEIDVMTGRKERLEAQANHMAHYCETNRCATQEEWKAKQIELEAIQRKTQESYHSMGLN